MTLLQFVCHRLPERSLWYGDHQSLFCSRCTGLYVGVLLVGVVCLALKTAIRSVKPSPTLRSAALLLILVMCVDVAAGAWQLRSGTNPMRLATGFGGGCGLGLLLLPPLLSRVSADVLSSRARRHLAMAVAAAFITVVFALSASPIGNAIDYFAVAGLITYSVSVWLIAFRTFRTAFLRF